jgi:hypothetical protein
MKKSRSGLVSADIYASIKKSFLAFTGKDIEKFNIFPGLMRARWSTNALSGRLLAGHQARSLAALCIFSNC